MKSASVISLASCKLHLGAAAALLCSASDAVTQLGEILNFAADCSVLSFSIPAADALFKTDCASMAMFSPGNKKIGLLVAGLRLTDHLPRIVLESCSCK